MERLVLTIEEAGQILGLGRTKMYELIHSGELPSFKVGRHRKIKMRDVQAWVDAQEPDVVPVSELPSVLQMPVSLEKRSYTRRHRTES